ncbi:NACHT domain-containing protein [Ornithinimicrobium kibberense]|uniref:NACHT domain-containing protein n=1 Tax=Ornithinimicrobium kibberense TaxID=282060 RepID=A0ABV5UZ88_9MICO|nr:NACHT domain-containing protein [Ornithinimicrobium kibberense]
MLEAIYLSLGTATVRAVVRFWLQEDVGLRLTDDFVDLLSDHIPKLRDRRRTARQFDLMAERVSDVVEALVDGEGPGLPEHEKAAAIEAVKDVVDGFQQLDKAVLFSTDLDPVALESILRELPAARQRSVLSESAQVLFDRLTKQASRFIIDMALNLPAFGPEALQEILRRESLILERLARVLDGLSVLENRPLDQDGHFRERYQWHLARSLDKLKLFGLALSGASREQALSIAYITLSASRDDDGHQYQEPSQPDLWEEGSSIELLAMHEANPRAASGDASVRVDAALASGDRHLIRGEAGSGKTTLLQWIAVSAARNKLEGPLAIWSEKVPFFIQLRRYVDSVLPSPEQFLEFTAATLAGAMPHAWVHRQLEAGKGLILIDGVDELPDQRREDAKVWLTDLVDTFPDCTFVVTSRPPAVPGRWLAGKDFSTAELVPMSPRDIEGFIQHWHDAAAAQYGDDAEAVAELRSFQGKLVAVIRDNRSIRSLATLPLLCAMLCALNFERRTQLPGDRMGLYRIALEMLLDRRDVEREILMQDSLALSLREKQVLMEEIAHWLLHNDKSDMTVAQAVRVIADRVENMPAIQESAESVYQHLLLRSGLIREPVAGRMDFVHRTFQEYLGAARAMHRGDIPYLITRAHSDQWREAVILAAGHATGSQADELLTGLLDRGVEEAPLRHRLHLLAVAALETAVEVSPGVVQRVHAALAGALPPQNMTDAKAVASAGEVAVAPLSAFADGSYATEAAACVRALSIIGSESALEGLARYAEDHRVTVLKELFRAWDYYDRTEYAARVLSKAKLGALRIDVGDLEVLENLSLVPSRPKVSLMIPRAVKRLGDIPTPDAVRSLIDPHSTITSLEGISAFAQLDSVVMSGLTDTVLPALPPSLQVVQLFSKQEFADLTALNSLRRLIALGVGQASTQALSEVRAPDLARLNLRGVPRPSSFRFLENFSRLGTLHIVSAPSDSPVELGEGGEDVGHIAALGHLRHIYVRSASTTRTLDGMPRLVRFMYLLGWTQLEGVDALSACHVLEDLVLDGARKLASIDPLGDLKGLRTLSLKRTLVSDISALSEHVRLRHVDVAYTAVSDISPLMSAELLSLLNIRGTPVSTLEPLADSIYGLRLLITPEQRDLVPEHALHERGWSVVEDA